MCSTPEHPLALVYDFMDHSNLGAYLRSNGNVRMLELVLLHCVAPAIHDLTDSILALRHCARRRTYARAGCYTWGYQHRTSLPSLYYDHALTFVQTNILVDPDGRACVAGLGAAYISSLVPGVGIDRFFQVQGAAPELVHPQRFGLPNSKATKHSDMHAFGVLAFEVGSMVIVSDGQAIQWSFRSLRCSPGKLRSSIRVCL